ncbi:MAG: RNA polymerase sigma factor [Planctomycetota bacterium]
MAGGDSTPWSVIRGAAQGEDAERQEFVRRYQDVVRAYLGARWRQSPLSRDLDDAVQDVFLDCFKSGGVLDRAESGRSGGFRAFFYGVIRNIARLYERRAARQRVRPSESGFDPDDIAADEEGLSSIFDRTWAMAVLREAGEYHAHLARERGEAAVKRVELLRLRFNDDLPIREVARLWQVDPARLHHEYAKARDEFRDALLEVVAFHNPGATRGEVEREGSRLLDMLG